MIYHFHITSAAFSLPFPKTRALGRSHTRRVTKYSLSSSLLFIYHGENETSTMSKVHASDNNGCSEGVVDVELLKDERGGLMWEEGITTITYYTASTENAFVQASEALQAQFALVAESNPWILGRLVKVKGKGVCLQHPAKPSSKDIEPVFRTIEDNSLPKMASFSTSSSASYIDICKELCSKKGKAAAVGSGYSLVGKSDRPVSLLTLTKCGGDSFALVFSMSHAIGDGRTYYEIYKMLEPGAAVRKLEPSRMQTFSESMRDMCGRKELEWADKASTQIMYTVAMLPMMLGCGKAPKCYAFRLDSERIASAKSKEVAASSGAVSYVSTNDIITSAFFNVCKARIGMMGLDCRERVDGVKADMAGNYVTALVLDPEVFGTPVALRSMYSKVPYETAKMRLPGACACCCGNTNFAMTTNWSSFGSVINLPDATVSVHLPVKNPAYCLFDLMIPFVTGADGGEIGVLCWTVSTDEEGLRSALPVGESVSNALFP